MTILGQLADHARERVAQAKAEVPFEEVKNRAMSISILMNGFLFF